MLIFDGRFFILWFLLFIRYKRCAGMTVANLELKRLRKINNLSQKEIAQKLEVSSARYSSWERGERQPSIEFLKKIANILKCNVSSLIELDVSNSAANDDEFSNDRRDDFYYFFSEDDKNRNNINYLLEEFIVKLSLFSEPLKFNLTEECRDNVTGFIGDPNFNFIEVHDAQEKIFHINRSCIEWAIFHDDAADNYPSITGGLFHETPLQKAIMSKQELLWVMSRNGNSELNDDALPDLAMDFEWLIQKQSRLIDDIEESINYIKEKYEADYINMLHDTQNTGYMQNLSDAWGVRIYLLDGKEIYLPGFSSRSSGIEAIMENIDSPAACSEDMSIFSDYENLNTYMIPTKSIAMIEYPKIYEGMSLYSEYSNKQDIISYEETDDMVEKFYNLVWKKG